MFGTTSTNIILTQFRVFLSIPFYSLAGFLFSVRGQVVPTMMCNTIKRPYLCLNQKIFPDNLTTYLFFFFFCYACKQDHFLPWDPFRFFFSILRKRFFDTFGRNFFFTRLITPSPIALSVKFWMLIQSPIQSLIMPQTNRVCDL